MITVPRPLVFLAVCFKEDHPGARRTRPGRATGVVRVREFGIL